MSTLMLTRNEAQTVIEAAFGVLQKEGFQFEECIPRRGQAFFKSRHPYSGQIVAVRSGKVSPRGASDPERLSWVRIELSRYYITDHVIKPWRKVRTDSVLEEVRDFTAWTQSQLQARVDSRDLRNRLHRWLARHFLPLPKATYPRSYSFSC